MPYLAPGREDLNWLRHLVLLYRDPGKPWTADDLLPYVAHLDQDGRPDAPLFDSMLFLSPQAANGRHFCADINRGTTMSGEGDFFAWCSPTPAAKPDWETLLEFYLGPNGAVRALEEALTRLPRAPQTRRNVVLMVPYPHVSQRAWGELSGRMLDFSVTGQNLERATRDRLLAVRWFCDEVQARFARLGCERVHLLGVYWMYESMRYSWEIDDHWLLKELRPHLRANGLALLWIPFWSRFNVHQLDDYESHYFDAAFLQPNFMFYRRGKTIAQAARAARQRGAGIEMEYYLQLDEPIAVGDERHARFREYLNGGVTYGYMHRSACAWFLGMDTFPQMRRHADPRERGFYEDIARFVAGSYQPQASGLPQAPPALAALALDLGGTNLRAALVGEDGSMLAQTALPTPRSPEAILAAMQAMLLPLRDRARAERLPLAGIGVSTGGRVDARTGTVVDATALLPGWRGIRLGEVLRTAFGLPVHVDNDGHCAALAEQRFGAGRDCSHFVTLVLGTGLGGGIVVVDRLVRGAANAAGELGHVSVDAEGEPCACGNRGCAELYVSGSGLARSGRTAPELAAAAHRGDAAARGILREAGQRLGLLLVDLLHLLNPERVVLAGPVTIGCGDMLLGPALDVVAQQALPTARANAAIVRSTLSEPGLLGAAALVLEPHA